MILLLFYFTNIKARDLDSHTNRWGDPVYNNNLTTADIQRNCAIEPVTLCYDQKRILEKGPVQDFVGPGDKKKY